MKAELFTLTGKEIGNALDDLAALRVKVFREWPYLYEGSLDYERTYLRRYAQGKGAVVVGALAGKEIVGAATGQPLGEEVSEFRDPFEVAGFDPATIFYFAESVLDPRFRGQGLGHGFFDAREAHARALGFDRAAFCAVIRPMDHPARPKDYSPLEPFWRKRGYLPVEGLTVGFDWPDVGETASSRKQMQVWMRDGLLAG
ncbi:GNAT family N-acetyltransferase [Stappia indica]|uniref:GNAT family N-acetyltransferase n=1 Tax=Stappia indica TaxID=538381 RepID=UPI0008330338|nr:GNAT family N-acetyltransferase [Stappia indica]